MKISICFRWIPVRNYRSVMIRRSLQWLMEWICQRLPRFVCWPRNYLPGKTNPILLKDCLTFGDVPLEPNVALLRASVVIGTLLCDGIGDAILVRGESGAGQSLRLAYNVLQAAGCRSFKTDYVACPSCGRTLFDLQEVTARIKTRTEHLKGVKIAIMGCIVNGPGEMADADFGYVGGAPGKINLYVGKSPVRFNIPEKEAVESLVDLIKEHDKWVEPIQADS